MLRSKFFALQKDHLIGEFEDPENADTSSFNNELKQLGSVVLL